MKKIGLLFLCGALVATSAIAESISDQLKVAECAFTIQHNGKELRVLDQKITLRAVENHVEGTANAKTRMVSAAGYRAYHLEIAYERDHIQIPYEIRRVEFINNKKVRIHILTISPDSRTMSETERNEKLDVRYLALNLENIPLVLLDDVTTINLIP